ncbi:MAG: protein translocase subunit SecF [Magnetospirillum sp. WYHS-4]
MRRLVLVRHDVNFDFIGRRILFIAVSAFIVLASFLSIAVQGLELGIDFRGGIMMDIRTKEAADIGALRSKLNDLNLGDVSLQQFGGPTDFLINLPQQPGGEAAQQGAVNKVKEALGTSVEYRRTEVVGPKVGRELMIGGIISVVVSLLAILAYVWFRFEWQFALAGVAALAHDVVTTVGLFSIFGLQFDLTILAAVLTIAGYSINDTVVIFDRVRENMRKYKTMPIPELLNKSNNETLPRTVMTAGTVFLTVLALLFLGGETLRGFSVAMVWGTIAGTYSTVCVAVPLLLYLKLRRPTAAEEGEAAVEQTAP